MIFLVHFSSMLTFIVLDCPQLVQGEYSVALHVFPRKLYNLSTSPFNEKQC